MKCSICNSLCDEFERATILNKYSTIFYHCSHCNSIMTGNPYWLEEAYQESIASIDTGILLRNELLKKRTTIVAYNLFSENINILDYAGGYGFLTRLLRDVGFNCYWDDKYSDNLVARGFEYQNHKSEPIDLITAYELFEHLEKPITTIEKLITITDNILFSTQLLPDPIPKPDQWWYYALESGQHIHFYSIETLQYIADKFKLNLYTNRSSFHLFTKKEFSTQQVNEFILSTNEKLFKDAVENMESKTVSDMNYIKAIINSGSIN